MIRAISQYPQGFDALGLKLKEALTPFYQYLWSKTINNQRIIGHDNRFTICFNDLWNRFINLEGG